MTRRRKSSRLAYSIRRLADETDTSRTLIYQEISAGRLLARKIHRRTLILRSDAIEWLRGLPCSRQAEISSQEVSEQ
jgi:hypothetical protein